MRFITSRATNGSRKMRTDRAIQAFLLVSSLSISAFTDRAREIEMVCGSQQSPKTFQISVDGVPKELKTGDEFTVGAKTFKLLHMSVGSKLFLVIRKNDKKIEVLPFRKPISIDSHSVEFSAIPSC